MSTFTRTVKPLTRIRMLSRSSKHSGITIIEQCSEKFEAVLLCIANRNYLEDLNNTEWQHRWIEYTVSLAEKEKFISLGISDINLIWQRLAKVLPVWILDDETALTQFACHFYNFQNLFSEHYEFKLSLMLPLITSLYALSRIKKPDRNGYFAFRGLAAERDQIGAKEEFNSNFTKTIPPDEEIIFEDSDEEMDSDSDQHLTGIEKAISMLNKITDKVTSKPDLDYLIKENFYLKREIFDLQERVSALEALQMPNNRNTSIAVEYESPQQTMSRKRMREMEDEVPFKVIKLVGDTRAVFISRLRKDFTQLEVESKLLRLNVFPLRCEKLNLKDNSCSHFYVEIKKEDFPIVLEPCYWPEGCLVEEFRWIV